MPLQVEKVIPHDSPVQLGLPLQVCNEQLSLEDIVQLRYTPLVWVPFIRKTKFILHVHTYLLSKAGGQKLQHLVALVISIHEPAGPKLMCVCCCCQSQTVLLLL
jgi:hypothetical protein